MVHQVLDSAKRDWSDVQECHDGQWNRKAPFIREKGLFMILMGGSQTLTQGYRNYHLSPASTNSSSPSLHAHHLFRPGGFTHVPVIGSRNRNNVEAPTAKLELVDGKIHVPCDDGKGVSTGKADRAPREMEKVTRCREGRLNEL